MKKLLSLILILSMLTTLVVPLTAFAAEEASEEKTIDLYFIAGQSNAAGTTKITDASAAYLFAPELRDGFSNIHYAGNSRSNVSDVTKQNRDLPWQPVTLGLGITNNTYMGPEAGMAKALSAYYNEESGKEAGIIKYAMGGSALVNKDAENWASPSYVATLDAAEVYEGKTGQLYANFLEQVERNIGELAAYGGYTKINLCGLYWMQGCNDKTKPTSYKPAFEFFATDIRNDLSALMKEYTGTDDDCGASELPIVVGTISQTQSLDTAGEEAKGITFIEMQKALPETVENCYVVDNSQFQICGVNDEDVTTPVVVGSDKAHWNQADMLTIGKNVGKELLLHGAEGYVAPTAQYATFIEGTAEYAADYAAWEEKLSETATASAPKTYEISTASELLSLFYYLNANISDKAKTQYRTFKLTADIDLNPGVDWAAYNADPIGYDGIRPTNLWIGGMFYGTFDGQGHSVTGLWHENLQRGGTSVSRSQTIQTAEGEKTVNFKGLNGLGFIYLAQGGTVVRNLVLGGGRFHDSGKETNRADIGAIVGSVYRTGNFEITKCYVSSDFTIDASDVPNKAGGYGGIVGAIAINNATSNKVQNVTIEDTVFAGTLLTAAETNTTSSFGYLIGDANSESGTPTYETNLTMTDCMFAGTVRGTLMKSVTDMVTVAYGTNGKAAAGECSYTREYVTQPTAVADGLTATASYGILPTDVADMMETYYDQHYTGDNKQYAELILIDTVSWEEKLASEETVFEIGTASELMSLFRYLNANKIGTASATQGKTFQLTADIDLNEGVDWTAYNADPEGYTGIRPTNVWVSTQFWGTFDGQGHTIRGLWYEYLVRQGTSYTGIKTVETAVGQRTVTHTGLNGMGFIYLAQDGAVIQNLVLDGGRFHDDGAIDNCNIGAVVGSIYRSGDFTVQNVYVGSSFTVDASRVANKDGGYGGIVGANSIGGNATTAQNIVIRNAVFAGTLVTPSVDSPETAMGYIIGETISTTAYETNLTMTDCMFDGTVTGANKQRLEVLESVTACTTGTTTGSLSEARNYTAQPESVGDDVYLAKHNTYGVLPVAVADMLSEYYVQDNGTDNARILSEVNSLGWQKIGYDVVITRDSDGNP